MAEPGLRDAVDRYSHFSLGSSAVDDLGMSTKFSEAAINSRSGKAP
jgi:hypothetical protein